MDFILATTNHGKLKEMQAFLNEDCTVRTLADIGFFDEIVEDGTTFAENALIKVKAVCSFLKSAGFNFDYVLADDSGLEVDALDGGPGVDSAVWMGKDTPYSVRNRQMLRLLANIPDSERTARFVTVIACCSANGEIQTAEGVLEGLIAREIAGDGGFGYDPIFFVPSIGHTLAQLSASEKNRISHRALALKRILAGVGFSKNGVDLQ